MLMQGMRKGLTGIVAKYILKNKDELNICGVSLDHTLLDKALEEISEKMEKADKLHNQTAYQNAKSVYQDALKAKEMKQTLIGPW